MSRGWLLLPASFIALAFTGCADPAGGEKTFARTAEVIEEFAGILEKASTVREARPRLEAAIHKLEAVREEGKHILLTRTQMADIQSRYLDRFRAAHRRLHQGVQDLLRKDPGGAGELKAVVARLDGIMTGP